MLPTANWHPMAAIIRGTTSQVQFQKPVNRDSPTASKTDSIIRAIATAAFFPRRRWRGLVGRTKR